MENKTTGYNIAMSFKPFIDPKCKEHMEIVNDMAKTIDRALKVKDGHIKEMEELIFNRDTEIRFLQGSVTRKIQECELLREQLDYVTERYNAVTTLYNTLKLDQ